VKASRLRAAGGALDRDQRFAAISAAALIATMFLPWYEKSVVVPGTRTFATDTISAFGAVSFVEAAIFLVAAGVLVIVLTRAEGGRYHLPGGDGTVILGAGLWASALIFYRVFDRPDVSGDGGTVGIQWGFFVAFVAAAALAVAGERMRAAGRPEPPLRESRPGRQTAPAPPDWGDESTEVVPASRTEVVPASRARTEVVPASHARTEVVPASEARGGALARRDRTGDARAERDRTGAAPAQRQRSRDSRPPRDRAVRREDAADLTLDDPPDAPLGPGDPAADRH
jgi:hypothetical protein